MLIIKITDTGISTTSRHNTRSTTVAIGRAVRKRYGAGQYFYLQSTKAPCYIEGVSVGQMNSVA